VLHAKKPTAQTGTFGFCRNARPTLQNQKSLFFANARTETTKLTDRKERHRVNGDKQTETKKGTKQSLFKSKAEQD